MLDLKGLPLSGSGQTTFLHLALLSLGQCPASSFVVGIPSHLPGAADEHVLSSLSTPPAPQHTRTHSPSFGSYSPKVTPKTIQGWQHSASANH